MRAFLILGSSILLLACTSRSEITPEPDAGGTKDAANDAVAVPDATNDANTNQPGWVSGQRLRARVMNGSDGSKHFVGWYDSMRKEDCTFRKASDDVLRCLPDVANQAVFYFGPSCDGSPVLAVPHACSTPTPTIMLETSDLGCSNSRTAVRSVELPVNPPNLYQRVQGVCMLMDVTKLSQTYKFFATGLEVDPKAFVDGSVKAE